MERSKYNDRAKYYEENSTISGQQNNLSIN